jgi:hypothetical protein
MIFFYSFYFISGGNVSISCGMTGLIVVAVFCWKNVEMYNLSYSINDLSSLLFRFVTVFVSCCSHACFRFMVLFLEFSYFGVQQDAAM